MPFPCIRPRRTRRTENLRRMVRETRLDPSDLVMPYFVAPGEGVRSEIVSMPGQYRLSVDQLVPEVEKAYALGVPSVLLFGIPPEKDEIGSGAWNPEGEVPRALRALKDALPDLVTIADVCMCEYTSHGHCGRLNEDGEVQNDPTLSDLARTALAYAEAGADIIAPSDMMDGRVAAIRASLDEEDFSDVAILSYAVKFASAYYGPFRDAADSAPQFGDRRGYQMDPANGREAMRELLLDEEEGADMLMVKPALAYLDIVAKAREATDLPLFAYNVSGEYAMVKAAAERGWIDEKRVVLETMLSFKRAGLDGILTYHAVDVAGWIA